MDKKETMKRKEMAEEALKAIKEIESLDKAEGIVKDNKIKFEVDKIKYRLRPPTPSEKKEMFDARRKKYLELVQDETYKFKKQWVEIYKKQGIDIEKMSKQITILNSEMEKIGVELAKATDKKTITTLKNEFISIKNKMYDISIEMADLLSYSIEDQLNTYATAYVCYLVFEKFENNEWKRCFKSYEEFDSTDSKAVTQALSYINYIIYEAK